VIVLDARLNRSRIEGVVGSDTSPSGGWSADADTSPWHPRSQRPLRALQAADVPPRPVRPPAAPHRGSSHPRRRVTGTELRFFGHSTLLLTVDGVRVLTDPVL